MQARIEVLCFEKCPHGDETLRLTREVAASLLPGSEVQRVDVLGEEAARSLAFPGSPTVRVDGADIAGRVIGVPGLRCRLYAGGGDMPPRWMIEAGMLRALRPGHILFLCSANSARSQMAEGLARHLAPEGVTVSSAGSRPTHVRPEALRVLSELEIDISGQRSKGLDEIDFSRVDVVVTLCGEEACPALPMPVTSVHWGLEDPAAVEGDEEARLRGFRLVRDEIRSRLGVLFYGWTGETAAPAP
jgi:arsenate reductase